MTKHDLEKSGFGLNFPSTNFGSSIHLPQVKAPDMSRSPRKQDCLADERHAAAFHTSYCTCLVTNYTKSATTS